eukprot:403375930
MGINQSKEDFKYACFNKNQIQKPEGETKEIVNFLNADNPDHFESYPIQGLDTIWKYFQRSVKNIPDKAFLGTLKPQEKSITLEYNWSTFKEVYDEVDFLIKAFHKHGICSETQTTVEGFRLIGIYAENRQSYITTQLAAMRYCMTVLPVFFRYSPDNVKYLINQAALETICVSSGTIQTIINLLLQEEIKSIQTIISYDEPTFEQFQQIMTLGVNFHVYTRLVADGKAFKEVIPHFPEPTPQTVFLICYTSGTTGEPKGVILNHANMICGNTKPEFYGFKFGMDDVYLSYVPLSHVYEQIMLSLTIINGMSLGFSSGNISQLMQEIQKLQPTIFGSFPSFYNQFYRSNLQKLQIDYEQVKDMNENQIIAVLNSLGGNIKYLISGGAPLSQEVFEFLKHCFKCPIIEAYGITEISGSLCSTSAWETQAGISGGPLPCLKIKLVDIPELGYLSTDNPPRGEVRVKGKPVFQGYYKNEEQNKFAFDQNGWYRTGDVAMLLPNGSVKVIDRIKNICKTQHGLYVAPNFLENIYSQCSIIKQIFVSVQPQYEAVCAVIFPDREILIKKALEQGLEEEIQFQSEEKIFQNSFVRLIVQEELDKKAQQHSLLEYEKIDLRFILINQPFQELGILNTSMKMMRHEAELKFKDTLNKIQELSFT